MTLNNIKVPEGLSYTFEMRVRKEDTAKEMGSGSLDVFATPSMVAMLEKASVEAVGEYIPEGFTTVGIKVEIDHLKASKTGATIKFESRLIKTEGYLLSFEVKASENDKLVGSGTHKRYIVEIEKFLNKSTK